MLDGIAKGRAVRVFEKGAHVAVEAKARPNFSFEELAQVASRLLTRWDHGRPIERTGELRRVCNSGWR